ncbi:unnamed protein product [Microthlaspi erraticum]|uniref:DUF3444 domain-containing protein n=1 Tax=Microthlaspi erraticum TaxID=1685480 RepID=A0A6D2LNI3_9BRAS|nr:unnamed protein product [Microthlaspi erraticum]
MKFSALQVLVRRDRGTGLLLRYAIPKMAVLNRAMQEFPMIMDVQKVEKNDFDKVREDTNFEVGQTWALYDTATDGMPRLYAQVRKVSAPCFRLRITYLEPDPKDEKEIQWCEEDLPVSAGKFRLGKNENTKDRSIFSHLMQCSVVSNTRHFFVSPRKGETWAMFKNWDIKWSSEPDSHRKYEYEFVEVLSDYADDGAVCIMPEISLDGIEYTILPKVGEVWVIYRYWSRCHDVEDLEKGLYDIVEILDDTSDFEVLLLVQACVHDDDDNDRFFKGATEYVDNEDEGSEPIFTIPKSERIRFSNPLPASRVTKEISGELNEYFRVEFHALPINVIHN